MAEPTEEQITAAIDVLAAAGWGNARMFAIDQSGPRDDMRRALVAAYAATPQPDTEQRLLEDAAIEMAWQRALAATRQRLEKENQP